MSSASAAVSTGRARYAVAALIVQVLAGILYSWSIFRIPLAQLHGWTKAQTIAPYRYSVISFAVAMILAGFWQDRRGPRVVAGFGGFLVGTGCLLAARFGDTVGGMVFSFGVVAGFGVGCVYLAPVATCIKWFPDKRGTIVGLAVMGFGLGPLVFGPLIESLIGHDPARLGVTIPRTFIILAIIFYLGIIGAAQFFRLPPPGWKPANWTPTALHLSGIELSPLKMLSTWQFFALWMLYFLGASVGLATIGQAAPLLQERAPMSTLISAGMALGIMGIFNGLGRIALGTFSDRFGRKAATLVMSLLSVVACLGFLRSSGGFWTLLTGLCLAAFSYGGYGAIIPALTADYYGPKNVGANYGLVFSAWGLCGFIIPGYFESILDRARLAGNLVAGYREVYLQLGVLAVAGAAIAFILRPPRSRLPSRSAQPTPETPLLTSNVEPG